MQGKFVIYQKHDENKVKGFTEVKHFRDEKKKYLEWKNN